MYFNTRMKSILLIVSLSLGHAVKAQTFDWWAQLVDWDGTTEWPRYIITKPKYLGPNALPVPLITNGTIDSVSSLTLTSNFHFSKGDNTQNLAIYGNYSLVRNKISFDAYWVPFEYFNMSHAIKEERHVFSHFYYYRKAMGDLHLNTNIQLLNKWRKHIHLAMRVGYRFPTSSGLGMARFTDAPGFYFDLSFGKPFDKSPLKIIGMAGLYVWQTNTDGFRQNDAFLFGSGLEWNRNKWKAQVYGTGYLGYMKNGDKPVMLRAFAERKLKRFSVLFRIQKGLHDFNYTSLEAGVKYNFR
jgi:hypothetical protein